MDQLVNNGILVGKKRKHCKFCVENVPVHFFVEFSALELSLLTVIDLNNIFAPFFSKLNHPMGHAKFKKYVSIIQREVSSWKLQIETQHAIQMMFLYFFFLKKYRISSLINYLEFFYSRATNTDPSFSLGYYLKFIYLIFTVFNRMITVYTRQKVIRNWTTKIFLRLFWKWENWRAAHKEREYLNGVSELQ